MFFTYIIIFTLFFFSFLFFLTFFPVAFRAKICYNIAAVYQSIFRETGSGESNNDRQ